MKPKVRFLFFAITIFTVILSACSGTAVPVTRSEGTLQTPPATFIAVVENITGDQWILSGRTLTVDPGVVSEGPFNVGDLIKVEVIVDQDGTFAVSNVEAPTVQELSTLPRLDDGTINPNNANNNDNTNVNGNTNVNSNDNTNNANSNDNTNNTNSNVNVNNNSNDNSNDTNSNDGNANNSNDDNSNENNENNSGGNQNDNDNDNDDDENDNDSSGPGSGGNVNDDNGGNDNDDNDNG